MIVLKILKICSFLFCSILLFSNAQNIQQANPLIVWSADDPNGPDMTNLYNLFFLTIGSNLNLSDPITQDNNLKQESCVTDQQLKQGISTIFASRMCNSYIISSNKSSIFCLVGLTKAECTAVTMFTTAFFYDYNLNMRNNIFQPYIIFTTILFSAIKKISKLYPLPANTLLYRGTNTLFLPPDSKRMYFRQFSSTTTSKSTAVNFGNKTIFQFGPNSFVLAAQISKLSEFPTENEVLLTPFEAFDFISLDNGVMVFQSSVKQDIFNNSNLINLKEFKTTISPKSGNSATKISYRNTLTYLYITKIIMIIFNLNFINFM